ncbi:MAG: SWIM zinc finger family protein [Vulcanimicrobiota bacterium]
MINVLVDYSTPSALQSEKDRAFLGFTANERRPVRFRGLIKKDAFLLRLALRALGELIWSSDMWLESSAILDPVITVHRDRIFFEAFSADESAYGMVIVEPSIFETEGDIITGTTNVDFSAWLWAALAELRTSRDTWFTIDSSGFEVKTGGAGGRFEQKVELPPSWVRAFLETSFSMSQPGTLITVRPVDLLAALRYLRYTKAKLSPRALRYEFEPGRDASLVLEPWEYRVPLKGASHNYEETRTIRTWGRRRLRLIEPLLPFADSVEIYLKGRALPSFYAVRMSHITFVIGLSGWSGSRWTEGRNLELAFLTRQMDSSLLSKALEALKKSVVLTPKALREMLGVDEKTATALFSGLCRKGLAIYDIEERAFRHRELFEEPVDEELLFPPEERRENALSFIEKGEVHLESVSTRETRKIKGLPSPDGLQRREIIYRDWQMSGKVGKTENIEIVVTEGGRIIFGTCQCPFFKENLLNRGPCEHMLALYGKGMGEIRDLPTSNEVTGATAPEEPLRHPKGEKGEDPDSEESQEE